MVEKYNIRTLRNAGIIKRTFCCLIILLLAFSLCSCDGTYVEGLENCNTMYEDFGLDKLLHDRSFLDKYSYTDGNFYYYGGFLATSRSLLYLKYNDETYLSAKEELVANSVCSDFSFNYNGFIFKRSLFVEPDSPYKETVKFEGLDNFFHMIAFNDEKRTIVSIGYCTSDKEALHGRDIKTDLDFAKFIETYYLEFYDFK